MKKKPIIFLVMAIILLTGCSKEEVLCTSKESYDELLNVETTRKVVFKDDKASSIQIDISFQFLNEDEAKNDFDSMGEGIEEYKAMGFKVTTELNGKRHDSVLTADTKDLNEEAIKDNYLDFSKEEYISKIENDGFICK